MQKIESFQPKTIRMKVFYCDSCEKRIEGWNHSCFVCKKDLCDSCRKIIEDGTTDWENDEPNTINICQEHYDKLSEFNNDINNIGIEINVLESERRKIIEHRMRFIKDKLLQ